MEAHQIQSNPLPYAWPWNKLILSGEQTCLIKWKRTRPMKFGLDVSHTVYTVYGIFNHISGKIRVDIDTRYDAQ